jgi:hypothetical protein
MLSRIFTLLFILSNALLFGSTPSKEANSEAFQLNIQKISQQIKLDGILDEEIWKSAQKSSDFINKWPQDTGLALARTTVQMAYDDEFIYLSAICHQEMDNLVVQSLKRDNMRAFWNSDGFSIVIDPISQKANGYLFGVNAGGAQVEATLAAKGGQTNFDSNWDNKWFSSVKQYEDHWVVEMAIPFKTLRYNESNREWGINLIRNDMKRNIYSTWAQVPLAFRGIDLGYYGSLQWDASPKKTKGNVAIIPYVSTGRSQNYEDGEQAINNVEAGLDAKIAITSSLNLDLTVNPDFSNVDVDQQVTNVSRFNVFFPEKRGFFLENNDLFSDFGTGGVRPFFSRKIGIVEGEPVPIAFGARISGNITDDIRIGLMDVHTRASEGLNPTNYFVGTVQKRILDRSAIKVLFNNKQDFPTETGAPDHYNRTGGLEFNYTSSRGDWNGNARAHWSTTEEKLNKNQFLAGDINYRGENLRGGLSYSRVGENYIAEMGFVPRLSHYDPVQDTTIRIGYQTINPWIGYQWYGAEGSNFRQQEAWFWTVFENATDGEFLSRRSSLSWNIIFQNNFGLRLRSRNNSLNLQVPFELIEDEKPLPVGRYDFTNIGVGFSTNELKTLVFESSFNYGGFYSGTRLRVNEELKFRIQPWGVFSVSYELNKIDLGEEYGETTIHLAGPKTEISLRNNMWWTTYLQFNTQNENLNINSRLQWRYKPMSDMFIVYSDNYATTDFSTENSLTTKNRGIVFKLTYWLNM